MTRLLPQKLGLSAQDLNKMKAIKNSSIDKWENAQIPIPSQEIIDS